MPQTDAIISEILGRLDEAVRAHGDAALNAAFAVIRLNALQVLIYALGGIVAAIVAFLFLYKWYRKEEWSDWNDDPMLFGFGLIGVAALAIPSLLVLFNPWLWISIFNPKLELAHHILTKILK